MPNCNFRTCDRCWAMGKTWLQLVLKTLSCKNKHKTVSLDISLPREACCCVKTFVLACQCMYRLRVYMSELHFCELWHSGLPQWAHQPYRPIPAECDFPVASFIILSDSLSPGGLSWLSSDLSGLREGVGWAAVFLSPSWTASEVIRDHSVIICLTHTELLNNKKLKWVCLVRSLTPIFAK